MGSEKSSAEKKEDDKKEGENKEVEKEEPTKEQKENEKEKISEGVLAKLSETIKIKNELAARVGVLKESPLLKEFERASQVLDEKRKRLEGLKKPNNSSQGNGSGSINMSGNISSSIKFEGSMTAGAQSNEKIKEINLESEALVLIIKTENDILKLQKEEIEFGAEGISVKNGELDVESRKVDAELDIWNGGMDQKTFDETIQKLSSPEGASADIKDKEKFLKFKNVDNEAQVYREKNIGFYKTIEDMQSEIDKRDAENLECPNEGKILEILGAYDKGKENIDKDNEKPEIEPETKPEVELKKEDETEPKLEKTDAENQEIKTETPTPASILS